MIRIALQMLIGDKLKYLALILGLSFSAMMIAQQASIFNGYASRAGAWVRDTAQGDLWVMDSQVEVTIDQKRLSQTELTRVRSVEGVDWAVPMFMGGLNAKLPDGSIKAVRLIGLDDASLMGGPPAMIQGKLGDLRQDRAVIVNQQDLTGILALNSGGKLQVGDRIDINDNDLSIVGVYAKNPEFFWEPVVYTTFSRAVKIAPPERKTTQYILVKAKPGQDITQLQARIQEQTGLAAHTNDEFAIKSTWYVLIQTGILINFGITIALGFFIGVLVSALLLYTFVLENTRQFGALKAMGTTNRQLITMVLVQAVFAGLVGYGLGLGMASMTRFFAAGSGLAFNMVWQIPLIAGVGIILACVVAAMVSLIRVLKLEPGIVFR
jgi:putative ABC transport system permease protein